ncbi:MAG: hypothetical protein GY929_01715 [Actinomycetia bacterium]|nr:hypothetical protein [Actinomycetes bacterium]
MSSPEPEPTLVEMVEHLETTHHVYLGEALPRLSALASRVAGSRAEEHPELVEVERLVEELRADLEPHLFKEEHVLFPMIRELAGAASAPQFHCGTLRNPITVMGVEHDRAAELLDTLRTTTGGYEVPADGDEEHRTLYEGLEELEADTRVHMHKENDLLFPAVLEAEQALGG